MSLKQRKPQPQSQNDQVLAQNVSNQGATNASSAKRPSASERIEQLKATQSNLGDIDGLNAAAAAVGTIIDLLIPRDGDKADLSINFNIPVHPLVKISFGVSGSAMRLGKKVLLMSDISLGVKMEKKIKLFLELEAFLKVSGKGYLKATGDSAEEAFAFMGLGAREIVAGHSQKAANFMMSSQERERVVASMSGDEYAELGLGLSVSAGGSFSSDADKNNRNVAGGEVGAGGSKSIMFSDKNNDGVLEKTNTAKVEASIKANLNLEKFGLKNMDGSTSAGISVFYAQNQLSKIMATMSFDASIESKDFGVGFLAEIFANITGELFNIMSKGSEYFSGSGAQKLGAIAHTANNISVGDNVLSRVSNNMSSKLGFKSKPNFLVLLIWKPGGACNLILKVSSKVDASLDLGVVDMGAGIGDTILNHNIPFQV